MIRTIPPLAVMLFCLLPAVAQARMLLELPVACDIGSECFIQNYFDHDRSEGATHDYTCGGLSYDGHKGTDFRVPLHRDLERGIDVVAVHRGTVNHIHNHPEFSDDDIPVLRLIKAGVQSPCGEGVRINHGSGWESIYCHLRSGSVLVREGEHVEAGQVIAQMGSSGDTQFPHLHYELRHHNAPVDPFVGYAYNYRCEDRRLYTLWTPEVMEKLQYIATGVVAAGFSGNLPEAGSIRSGDFTARPFTADAPQLHFWLELYGIHEDDVLTLRMLTPDGEEAGALRQVYEEAYAVAFEVLAASQPQAGWPEGVYTVRARLERSGSGEGEPQVVLEKIWQIPLGNAPDDNTR